MKINKAKLYVLDTGQLTQFKQREKQKIGMPECILEEYLLTPGFHMTHEREIPPGKQYIDSEGFEFSWGHILERRTDKYIVWDFCFTNLLSRYLRAGKRLSDLQRAVYYVLERKLSCTTRDIVPVLSMEEGWKIIPCSAVGAFTLVIHFTQEPSAREFVAHDLMLEVIPKMLETLQEDVSQASR